MTQTATSRDAVLDLLRRKGVDPKEALRQLDEELARQSLIEFGKRVYPDFKHPKHIEYIAGILERAERGEIRKIAISIAPGHGKLVADETQVPTVDGWKRHGDLVVGDWVFGCDGKPTVVVAVSEPNLASLEVEFADGSYIVVHPKHEWVVREYNRDIPVIRETQDIKRNLDAYPVKYGRGSRCKYGLPITPGLHGAPVDLLIDPYVLGAWLGDGSSTKACITHAVSDSEVVEAVEAAGHKRTAVCAVNGGTTSATYFNDLHTRLKTAGVFANKHIPVAYLRSSREQRLQLLAGLIDTDGNVARRTEGGDKVRIVCADERLARDIKELVVSLGWRVGDSISAPCISSSGIVGKKPVHYIGFVPDEPIPTRIPRKRIAGNPRRAYRSIGIRAVREVTPRLGRCIQVAAADGIYRVGPTMLPTHNSTLLQLFVGWFVGRDPKRRVLSVSASNDLAKRNSRYVRGFVQSEEWPWPDVKLLGESLEEWYTPQNGGVRTIGETGTVSGWRAELLLGDDIQADAGTDVSRKSLEERFRDVFSTRVEPGGLTVLINTRWRDDDLIGRLVESQSGEWFYINLPAEALENDPLGRVEGEALWPERWPLEELIKIKSPDGIGAASYAAQYQGDPVPSGGSTFQAEWLEHTYDELPRSSFMPKQVDPREPLAIALDPLIAAHPAPPILIQSVDSAWKTGTGNDFSVIATLSTDLRDIYVAHMTIGKWAYTELRRVLEADFDRWNPRTIYVEEAASGYALIEELKHAPSKIIPVVAIKPGHDSKESRAESVTGWFEAGRIKFPKSAPWLAETKAQLKRFPFGKHDDCVDALVRGIIEMQKIIARATIEQRRQQQARGFQDLGDWMSR